MSKSRKKKLKKTTIISRIILIIYLIITLFMLGTVISMNVLPSKYLIPILIGYGVLTILLGIFAWKNNFRNWIKIISDIIFTIIIVISSFALYYLNSTFNLLDNIKNKDYQIVDYYVLVLKDSEAQKLSDLDGHSLGIYETTDKTYKKALKKLEKKITIKEKSYETYLSEAEALIKIKQAEADGIRLLKEAAADEAVLQLKSYETLAHVADGNATKIIVPAELQGIATFGTALKEVMEDKKQDKK